MLEDWQHDHDTGQRRDCDSSGASACCVLCLRELSQKVSCVNTGKCQDEVTAWHPGAGSPRLKCQGARALLQTPGTDDWVKIGCSKRKQSMCNE